VNGLGQLDDDPGRPANVAELEHLLVVHHLAHELGAAPLQAGDDVVDVVDGEAEVAERPVT
jgi:hypothetical protein